MNKSDITHIQQQEDAGLVSTRRKFVAGVGAGSLAILAGCAGNGSPDDDDWQDVQDWMDDAVSHIEWAQFQWADWIEDSNEVVLSDLEEVADGADPILGDFDQTIEPIEEDIEEWNFTASRGGDEWRVDGEELHYTLHGLWLVVDDTRIAYDRAEDADGDPDNLEIVDVNIIEDIFEEGDEVIAESHEHLTGDRQR